MRGIVLEKYKGLCDRFEAKPSPKRAIKLFCLECLCCDRTAIKECTAKDCPLYQYRPFVHKIRIEGQGMSDEKRKAVAERFKKYRKVIPILED
jgi:hypothetical protein